MPFLRITEDFFDPELLSVEVVERKGVGHPDSLADALANEVSSAFSKHCLDRFGIVLPHNIDKLFIGGGCFRNDFGSAERIYPISVLTNGRMARSFEGEAVDIASIQREAISKYLFKVLPRLSTDDVTIIPNATQHHRQPYRYCPRSRDDIPHAVGLQANDTSLCISHWPPTMSESLAYRLERYFWEEKDAFPVPRFPEIGQDIKVFVLRTEGHLEIILSVPTMSRATRSSQQYDDLIRHHQSNLQKIAEEMTFPFGHTVSIRVNPQKNPYMLAVGSCIECGEEGLVGRGNAISGVISCHRFHTQESWAGKNPAYHTGRVLGYLTAKLARAVSTRFHVKCSVSSVTQCGGSLIPPEFLGVSVSDPVNAEELKAIVESDFLSADYVEEIISFRPWLTKL